MGPGMRAGCQRSRGRSGARAPSGCSSASRPEESGLAARRRRAASLRSPHGREPASPRLPPEGRIGTSPPGQKTRRRPLRRPPLARCLGGRPSSHLRRPLTRPRHRLPAHCWPNPPALRLRLRTEQSAQDKNHFSWVPHRPPNLRSPLTRSKEVRLLSDDPGGAEAEVVVVGVRRAAVAVRRTGGLGGAAEAAPAEHAVAGAFY